eukprot:scaffold18267_cov146-Isochrysis_galbana.AAC.6
MATTGVGSEVLPNESVRPAATRAPHDSSRPAVSTNKLCSKPAAMSGASRQRRCRAQRAR